MHTKAHRPKKIWDSSQRRPSPLCPVAEGAEEKEKEEEEEVAEHFAKNAFHGHSVIKAGAGQFLTTAFHGHSVAKACAEHFVTKAFPGHFVTCTTYMKKGRTWQASTLHQNADECTSNCTKAGAT